MHNLPGHLVYSASGADVDTVIVDGQVLMQNRQFKTLDSDDERSRAGAESDALLARACWRRTLEEPKAGLLASLQLKATQQSLKVMQVLVGNRAPDEENMLQAGCRETKLSHASFAVTAYRQKSPLHVIDFYKR